MKLLFDENPSPNLAEMLATEYPASVHVRDADLLGDYDQRIREYSKAQGYAIVSKDTDFRERSFVEDFPPKVIWLDVGNAGTRAILDLLRRERQRIEAFGQQKESSMLMLSLGASAI